MKNIEKYQNEIIEKYQYSGIDCQFIKKHVLKVEGCHGIGCTECGERTKEWLAAEYVPQIDWSKVPVDTPVVVAGKYMKYPAHFSTYEDDYIFIFPQGRTYWTTPCTEKSIQCSVNDVTLARPEDIEKYSI